MAAGDAPAPADGERARPSGDPAMTSAAIRDPVTDHLLTPKNSAFLVIDYQPIQVGSIRSMNQHELVFNIVHAAKAAVTYGLPVVHSTVNVATGRNKPPIAPLMDVLGQFPTYDRTSINSWEDVEFRQAVEATGRRKLVMTALWTEACLTFPALDARHVRGRARSGAAAHRTGRRTADQQDAVVLRTAARLEPCRHRARLHGRVPELGRVQSGKGRQGLTWCAPRQDASAMNLQRRI